MLSVRCTRFLAPNATRLAAPSINRTASGKNQIAESNMFWMRHQIQAKDGYHKHVNFERGVAVAALGSFVGAVAFPGTFILDQVVAVTFIAHGYWGVDHMIGDYVPLLAPVAVAKLLQVLWMIFSVLMVAVFTNMNLKVGETSGIGHQIRAIIAM